MISINGAQIGVLQVKHVIFSHFFLMGTLLWLSLDPTPLGSFAGSHSGYDFFTSIKTPY